MGAVKASEPAVAAASPQPTAAIEIAAAPQRRRRVPDWVYSLLVGVGIFGAAEILARAGVVSPLILPAPSDVFRAGVNGFVEGNYLEATWQTLLATLAGFALAAIVSLLIAGIIVSIPRLEGILMPYIVAFQALPKIALAPLFLLILGFGFQSKVVIVAVICFFPIMENAIQGMRIRDKEQSELMKSLGASRLQVFRYLRVPNSAPYVFAGLQIGLIFALVGAVVAEFVGAPSGLGVALLQERARFSASGLWAVLLVLTIMGLILRQILLMIEHRVAFWSSKIE